MTNFKLQKEFLFCFELLITENLNNESLHNGIIYFKPFKDLRYYLLK